MFNKNKEFRLISKTNIILAVFLLMAIIFSIIKIVRATTPNPGHSSTEIDFRIATKTSTSTLATNETVVLADAASNAFTLTLPTAVGNSDLLYWIKKVDASLTNIVTIDPNGSETIGSLSTITLSNRGEVVMIQSDGANWQVLARRSYDYSGYRTKGSTLNQWYTSPTTGVALSAAATTANVLRAMPFIVSKPTTIDQMAVNVTTLLAGNTRIGIYADNGNNYPGVLVVEATVTTQINTGTAGVKIATDGLPVTLDPGLYWLASVSNAAPTMRGIAATGLLPILGYSSTLTTAAPLAWSVAFTYAALPATFTAGGAVIAAAFSPAVFVRTSQ